MKKLFLISLIILVSGGILFSGVPSSAKDVIKLGFATKWPERNPILQWTYMPALYEIESKSKGRIKFTLYPNAVLGKPHDHYDIARTGKVDIAEFSPGYMPGRFPLSNLIGLPMCYDHTGNSSRVVNKIVDKVLSKEFTDAHLLDLHRTEHFFLQGNVKVQSLEDIKGLKIRSPSPIVGLAIKALGAEALNLSVTDLYLSLQTGVIDGTVSGSTIIPAFKIHEVTKYLLAFNFGCTSTGLVMNQNSWKKLPDDLKPIVAKAFAKNGFRHAMFAAAAIPDCWGLLKKRAGKGAVISLSPEEKKRWAKILSAMVDKWVNDLEAKGISARAALGFAREACKKKGVTFRW
ncbi:TRAP transporter substrate-binding protein [Thermodesulfobacteriota bacterium]